MVGPSENFIEYSYVPKQAPPQVASLIYCSGDDMALQMGFV